MNYSKHYDLLIERARNRDLPKPYERHHVIPTCVGGPNDKSNLVRLTSEEHYTAHLLLVKMYPGVKGLVYAAKMMTHQSPTDGGSRSKNKMYGWLREEFRQAVSATHKGKIVSAETKAKQSASHKGISYGPKSAETKLKMGIAKLGNKNGAYKRSEETKLKISIAQKGKIIPQEQRDKMSISAKKRCEIARLAKENKVKE